MLAHHTQRQEGFSPGASPEYVWVDRDDLKALLPGNDPRQTMMRERFFQTFEGTPQASAIIRATARLYPDMNVTTLRDVQRVVRLTESGSALPRKPREGDDWSTFETASDEMVGGERFKYLAHAINREIYRANAGEVEARNVQTRLNMNRQERVERPPWTTREADLTDENIWAYSRETGTEMERLRSGMPQQRRRWFGGSEGSDAYIRPEMTGAYVFRNPRTIKSVAEMMEEGMSIKEITETLKRDFKAMRRPTDLVTDEVVDELVNSIRERGLRNVLDKGSEPLR
jgi:hypothetical protein